MKLIEMPLGMSVYESGGVQPHIYFPTDSIVLLLHVMKNGASAEIAVVGNEGAVGVSLSRDARAGDRAERGHAYRLSSERLKESSSATATCCSCCCVTRNP